MTRNSILDTINVMTGRDLERAPKPKKEPKGKRRSKKAPEEEAPAKVADSKVTDEAKFAAYDYCADKDQLSADMRKAIKGEALSDNLKKALQVLLDNTQFRKLVASQDGVLPSPTETYLEWSFVDPESGESRTSEAEALLSTGTKVEDLEKFNLSLKVIKKRKLDDTDAGEATDTEIAQVVKDLEKKYKKTA